MDPSHGHVAVVEPERGGDGPRREVVVHRHRLPVDGGRVERSVPPPVDRDQPEHLAGGAVAVQVLVGVHADPVGGGHGAEGGAPFAERARDRRPLAAAATAAAPACAACAARAAKVDSQTVRKHSTWRQRPDGHRHGGGDDRAARPGRSPPPLIQVGWMRSASSMALAPPSLMPPPLEPGIGRQAVDVLEREPGVGDRLEAGVDGERERVDHEPPADRRPTDAAEDGPVLEALVAERGAGDRPHRFGDPVDRVDRPRQLEERAATRPRAARTGRRPPGRSGRRRARSRRCWS